MGGFYPIVTSVAPDFAVIPPCYNETLVNEVPMLGTTATNLRSGNRVLSA